MNNLEKHTQSFTTGTAAGLYDLSMLEEMDDIENMIDILTILLKETPADLKEMQQALRAGNLDIVCRKAHKIKGSAGIILAGPLIILLEQIEAMGKMQVNNGELTRLVETAIRQYATIQKALERHLAEISN